MIKRFKTDFITSIFTLVSGTMIAQIVTYLLQPVISRLYAPEDMAYLSLYARIVAFTAVIATLRYELAFPLPKRDEHAFMLYRISFKSTILVSLLSLVTVTVLFFTGEFDVQTKAILFFLPIGIFFTSMNSQGVNWSIRTKNYKKISLAKIFQSMFNASTATVLGFINFGYLGLIVGYILGVAGGSFLFIRSFFKTKKLMTSFQLKGRRFASAKAYKEFPIVNLPHVIIDLSKELFIAFYLIYTFEKEVLGLYDFSFRMLKMPIGIIGVSINQVFYKKAADLLNEGKSIYPTVKKTLLYLTLLSIIPFFSLLFFGPSIFSFVFGSKWEQAGFFSQIMSLWLMSNFIVSSISQVPILLKKQKQFFMLSLFGTSLLIFSMLLGEFFPYFKGNFPRILLVVSIGQFLFMTYTIFWTLYLAKRYSK